MGPLVVFILAMAGWSFRNAFVKQEEEIDKMALTQKEFEKSLLNMLLVQSKFEQRLQAGFDRIGADTDSMKTSIAGLQSNITGLQSNVDQMGADMDSMKTSIVGLQSELRDHRAAMDKEIAVIRERISRNGSP